MAKVKAKEHKKPERGGLLVAAIVFVIIHGFLVLGVALAENNPDAPSWFVPALGILAVLDIVAGILLWRWKIWGLYLYLITTIAIITVGMIATGSLGVAFSRIVPFLIVGYIVMPKRKYFT